jgi:hypothetical protein
MSNIALVDFNPLDDVWTVTAYEQDYSVFDTPEKALLAAAKGSRLVACNEKMIAVKLIELVAAAIFAGVRLCDRSGMVLTATPIRDSTPAYYTRRELGNILPEGWMIEHQLNRYAAMFGEELTFPARPKLMLAVADIRAFLAASALQASQELASSLASELQQSTMFDGYEGAGVPKVVVSSDRAKPAVDEVHRA